METIVVDGSNVVGSYDKYSPVSLKILLTVLLELKKKGIEFFCLFDDKLKGFLEHNAPQELEILNSLLREQNLNFASIPGTEEADLFILHRADEENCRILSNDGYEEYKHRYPWLGEKDGCRKGKTNRQYKSRLIVGKLLGTHVSIPNLAIHVPVNAESRRLHRELKRLF